MCSPKPILERDRLGPSRLGGRGPVGSEAPPLTFPSPRDGVRLLPDTPLSDTDFLPLHWQPS